MIYRLSISLPVVTLLLCCALPALPAEPANPDALPAAKKILDYLSKLPTRYDRRVISGQHWGQEENAARFFDGNAAYGQDTTGKRVAIIGADYGYPKDLSARIPPSRRSISNRILIDYWKSGGLAMVSFLARNPWSGGSAWDANTRDLGELITPGTAANEAWINELSQIADSLAELRDAGVVVLWRPFHQMNGGWFWWGKRQGEPFRREGFVNLWRHMFDYFTRTKKLNNLLWIYSAASDAHKTTSTTAFFPGRDYCDIVGLDSFSPDIPLDGYNEMVRLGKPFGITGIQRTQEESGLPDYGKLMAAIRFWHPLTTFFLSPSGDAGIVNDRNGAVLMNDPWIISRDELGWAVPGYRRWKQTNKLALSKVEVLSKDPVCWKRVDLGIDLNATFDTPFDPEQIEVNGEFTTPSGKTLKVPAFFDQAFERQMWGSGRLSEEAMMEAGPGGWRLRFMPTEPGEYRFRVRARDRSGSVESPPLSFDARRAQGAGYIRVSAKNPRYFEFDDGTPFFAIGLNMVEHPLSEYYRYIPRLAQSGGNFSRLWIGFDYFALELGAIGEYRLDNAWRLDQVMELSERYGIYQKICIDWVRHITPRGLPRQSFDREDYAYSVSNGGPCQNMTDFFTQPEARRLFKNRLRYIVARWGYSPNVMAWELWNEIDLVDSRVRQAEVVIPWNQEMCRYLKSIDPWQHLTTNSLAGRDTRQAVWTMEENQFAQRHGYTTPRPNTLPAGADMAGDVIRWLDDVAGLNKPYLMAEFGLQRDRMDVRALCDRDQEGVHMHAGIWAALAHGAAGTAQLWWWGQYVDPKNLYYHFQAVANFVRGIPWTTAGFVRTEVEGTSNNLRALGLRGTPVSILWLQNKSHTWWNVVSNAPIPAVEPGRATVAGFPPGRYRVEFWDTYEGRITSNASIEAKEGKLTLALPRIEKDVAVKILPEESPR